MFDPFMMVLASVHLFILVGGILYACNKWQLARRDWPFVLYIVLWADLILGAHGASIFHALDRLDVYIPATFVALAGLLRVFHYMHRLEPCTPLLPLPQIAFADITHIKARQFTKWFMLITFGILALFALIIAFSVYPDNADSMIYRLPRAFWYVSNGSFMHPFDSQDTRIVFYPLDGVALYIPLVLYNLPGTLHSFPSYITWLMLIYTVYRFSRDLGACRLISFASAWLVALTPSIIAESMSTNDEILSAVVLLVGLYMGWRWLLNGSRGYFMLAVTAIAISAGTKLHIVFLMPIIIAAFALALLHVYKKPELAKQWWAAIGWKSFGISAVMVLLMFAPFLIYNYLSSGRFYNVSDFAKDVFNWRASLQVSLQNLLIYVSQMTLSPIADLNVWPVADDRQHFNTMLNSFFNPLIKPFINTDPSFYHFGYRFVGVTIPTSVRFVEFSLWSGFVWLLWPLQWKLTLKQKFPLRALFFLLAFTPFLWLLIWSFTTRYMEGTATYFSYYLICAAPAAVFAFVPIRRPIWNELRWLAIIIVAVSNIIISNNMFMFSGFRSLPDLYFAKTYPFDWCLMDKPIIHEIRHADRMRVIMTHEKMPYFAFFHWHPNATFYSPYPITSLANPEKVLQIYPVPGDYFYGFMPLKIPNKGTKGLSYLGTIRGIGREVIFALGNDVEKRFLSESDYIVPHMALNEMDGKFELAMDHGVAGAAPEDNLEYAYELKQANDVVFSRDWSAEPSFSYLSNVNPKQYLFMLTIKVRSAISHKELTHATYQAYGPGSWLPEAGEY